MTARRLGVLGGTFDPMHVGHLDAGDAAQHALGLDEMCVIPVRHPPHRPADPHASAYHRFALVALAIAERRSWRVSDAELRRHGTSYTFDTLQGLQAEGWSRSQIFFILGADAFAEIATWRRFPEVLNEAHFVVISRPGASLAAALTRTAAIGARVRRPEDSRQVSADTAVIPIEAQTRNVSSSEVRRRLAAGQSIDDLVPPAVARHITAHHLYVTPSRGRGEDPEGAVDDLHGEKQRTHR